MRIEQWRRATGLLCMGILAVILSGCAKNAGTVGAVGAAKERIVLTTLYQSDFPNLEKLVETVYSDIDLQCEIMPYTTEQTRRMEKGAGPDLVIATQSSDDEMKKYLTDISDSSVSAAYDGTIMKTMIVDGRSYLLPLPGQYYGYIVNETLYQQAGLALPTTNRELVESLVKLKELGLGVGEDETNFAIQSDYFSDLGMFYTGYMVPDFLGTVEGVSWLADYQARQASFEGSWEDMFTLTDELIERGLLDPAPLGRQRNSIRYSRRMGKGSLAVVFGNSTLFSQCQEENQTAGEAGAAPEYSYRMLPFLSDEGNEPWMIFAPSAYIGINAGISEQKQEASRRVLELLSTQEGQTAVIQDMQMGASCLRGYESDGSYTPDGAEAYVKSGYIYNVKFPDQIIAYLGSNIQKLMAGELTREEVLQRIDQYYYEGSEAVDYDLSPIGAVETDLLLQNFNVRKGETELGNFLADCIAKVTKTPIAVVNGGNIRSSLYAGEIYGEDLNALFPFENHIVVMEMDGQTVWDMLENSVSTSSDEFPGGRFLQISGLHYTFDSGKAIGSRLIEVRLPDGSALDLSGTYQLAVNSYMAGAVGYVEDNGDGYTMLNWYDDTAPKGRVSLVRETGLTYREALKLYFKEHGEQAAGAKLEGRITDLAQR